MVSIKPHQLTKRHSPETITHSHIRTGETGSHSFVAHLASNNSGFSWMLPIILPTILS
jgi:hypothetical protein